MNSRSPHIFRAEDVLRVLESPGFHGYRDFEKALGVDVRTDGQKGLINMAIWRLRSKGHEIICQRGVGWQLAKYHQGVALSAREQEVVDAISSGCTTRGEIAKVLFPDDPPMLEFANKENVSVVCRRLRKKGVIHSPNFGTYAIKDS